MCWAQIWILSKIVDFPVEQSYCRGTERNSGALLQQETPRSARPKPKHKGLGSTYYNQGAGYPGTTRAERLCSRSRCGIRRVRETQCRQASFQNECTLTKRVGFCSSPEVRFSNENSTTGTRYFRCSTLCFVSRKNSRSRYTTILPYFKTGQRWSAARIPLPATGRMLRGSCLMDADDSVLSIHHRIGPKHLSRTLETIQSSTNCLS